MIRGKNLEGKLEVDVNGSKGNFNDGEVVTKRFEKKFYDCDRLFDCQRVEFLGIDRVIDLNENGEE